MPDRSRSDNPLADELRFQRDRYKAERDRYRAALERARDRLAFIENRRQDADSVRRIDAVLDAS